MGRDSCGLPVDARDLFDPELLQQLIETVFMNYYEGFTGEGYTGLVPLSVPDLSRRMIEEMGVDRHMEEIFRISDQLSMSDEAFRGMLVDRGCTLKEAGAAKKGREDIFLLTGPHLGEFNQRISLPELIAAVESLSASCIAGLYWKMHRDKEL